MTKHPLRHRWLLLKYNFYCLSGIVLMIAPVVAMPAILLQLQNDRPWLADLMPAWFLQASIIANTGCALLASAAFFLYTVSKRSPFRQSLPKGK